MCKYDILIQKVVMKFDIVEILIKIRRRNTYYKLV